jgi:hypothetical protein
MFETLSKAAKLKKGKELFQEAEDSDYTWQLESREDFAFRDGNQWTAHERQILAEELRPVLTFNLTKSSIDLIMGMNEDNRKRFSASPIEPTDAFLCEVLNDIATWVQETHDFETEEDGALESAAICGRGYVAIDFGPDPKRFGEIEISEIDLPVYEVHLDPAARRRSHEDASYICWDKWLPLSEFRMRYPTVKGKALEDVIAASRMHGMDTSWSVRSTEQAAFEMEFPTDSDRSDYDMPLDLNYYDKTKNMIRVIHMEYWESFERYYVFNPEAGLFEEAPEKPTKAVKEAFALEFGEPMTVEVIMDKKVKWLQFTGDRILYDDDSPMPYDGFSIVPVYAFRDVSKRTMNHFGLVRLMKDPQKEINKRWSQALNLLNQQVQPGIYAETDAFVDVSQAEQSMKEAGAITWTNAGAITGGKIKERNVPNFPNAPMQMEQFSQDIMKKITGINPDLLGQDRGRQEPGVVVRLRQQQGLTLLKPLFKSLNRAKKDLFKRQLAIIMAYMPDEQILRILGQNERYQFDKKTGVIIDMKSINPQTGQPTLFANLRDVRNLEYNVTAEESPGNMSKRMLELQALMEMMQAGFPVDPIAVLEKMELPASEKLRWIEYINGQQQAMAQQQQEQLAAELGIKTRELDIKEQDNMFDFIVDITKINQMLEKDEKKMVTDFAKLGVEERNNMAQFISSMLSVVAQVKQGEDQIDEQRRARNSSTSKEGNTSTTKK